MKCTGFLLFLLLFSISMNLFLAGKWKDSQIKYKNMLIRIIIYDTINDKDIHTMLEQADKSMETKRPNSKISFKGLIRDDDIIVISRQLMYWFSLTRKEKRMTRSGGGLLAGLWEIEVNDKNYPSLLRAEKVSRYTPNLLLIGSYPKVRLFGGDIFGGYDGNSIVWGLEYSLNVQATKLTGTEIILSDKGPYSGVDDQGLFIQTSGILGNANMGNGIDSYTDTDPRPEIEGKTQFLLTYRIPYNKMEFITDIELKAVNGNFGPISNAVMMLYLPGYHNQKIVYASHPELIPEKKNQLTNVTVNKWFKNTVVEQTYFYDVPNSKHSLKKLNASTPPGRGRILCLGSPKDQIGLGLICGYPNNDYIPQYCYEEFSLELSDNQTLPKIGKFHTLAYKLLTTPKKTVLLKENEKMSMIMRYKIINAYSQLNEGKGKSKSLIKIK